MILRRRTLLIVIFTALFSEKGTAQFYCNEVQISECGLTDTIPQNAIVVNPALNIPSNGLCLYVCNGGYLKLLTANGPGTNNIYIETNGTLQDAVTDNSSDNNIIAKAPSTINLISPPLNIKCDSGVIVNVGGQPMDPYPCICSNSTFDYTYIGNCAVGIKQVSKTE